MYEDNFVTTGFATHLALPLIRKAWREDMSEEECRKLMIECMTVCFYRDCVASSNCTTCRQGRRPGWRPAAHAPWPRQAAALRCCGAVRRC